jgi:hypothetical protein
VNYAHRALAGGQCVPAAKAARIDKTFHCPIPDFVIRAGRFLARAAGICATMRERRSGWSVVTTANHPQNVRLPTLVGGYAHSMQA